MKEDFQDIVTSPPDTVIGGGPVDAPSSEVDAVAAALKNAALQLNEKCNEKK
jgi:hypothetical protein